MPTFIFTDIEGSTRMWKEYPQSMAQAMRRHDAIIYAAVESGGGQVVEHTGDGVYAAFEEGNPLEVALNIQKKFAEESWGELRELRIRIGLNAIEPEQEGVHFFREGKVFRGLAVNEAARVTAIGWGGQILLTPEVLRHHAMPNGCSVVDLGAHMLKSLTQPRQIYGLRHPDLPHQDHPILRSLSVRPNNLPAQSTPFVGRERELKHIQSYLEASSCSLVTLAGPGGVGKTRLAIQAAAEAIELFPHGVFFVPLASISAPDHIVSSIAKAIDFSFYGVENQQLQLLNYLREKELLLVADNMEHLLDGAGILYEILQAAPRVKLLVTCRQWLNFADEERVQVLGLDVPDASRQYGLAELNSYSAVQLFLQVARRARADFTLNRDNHRDVVHICQMVAGMPLGIELSAAWVSAFSCTEISARIEANLSFIHTERTDIPERHRSLYAVFEYFWSHLSPSEKQVMRKLSLFRAGFTAGAASTVADASFFFLSALMDRAFLYRSASNREGPHTRYEMHEALRQYAEEQLPAVKDEMAQARSQYASYYATFLQKRQSQLRGEGQEEALAEILREIDNVRQAWEWAVSQADVSLLEQTFAALFEAYDLLGWYEEGAEMMARAAAVLYTTGAHIQENLMARLNARRAYFWFRLSNLPTAEKLFHESLQVARHNEDENEIAFCLQFLGAIARISGQYNKGCSLLRQSVEIYRRLSAQWEKALALSQLADAVYRLGRYEEARELMWESYVIRQKLNEPRSLASTLVFLGVLLSALGEKNAARILMQGGLSKHRTLQNNDWSIATASLNLGVLAYECGDYEDALRYHRRSLSIYRDLGNQWTIAAALDNLGQTALILGERVEAATHLRESLTVALEADIVPIVLDVLVGVANMLAEEQPQKALQILDLVIQHPRTDRGETEVHARKAYQKIMQRSNLPPGKQDKALSLEVAVSEALAYLDTASSKEQVLDPVDFST